MHKRGKVESPNPCERGVHRTIRRIVDNCPQTYFVKDPEKLHEAKANAVK